MSSVCGEAVQHGGLPTYPHGISLLGKPLIKAITGPGCTKLQREVVNRTFANEDVFHSITRELRRCFRDHAEGIQQELAELISTHLDAVRATLDIVREKNAAEENERDPEFRQRVADEVSRARSLMEI